MARSRGTDSNSLSSKDVYWATESGEDLLQSLNYKVETFYRAIQSNGIMTNWRRCFELYNTSVVGSTGIYSDGNDNEYTKTKINHLRNLVQHQLVLTVESRPVFEPRATNTDEESQSQTILAKGLLDYYMREKHVENFLKDIVEYSILFGEGFMSVYWDVSGGEVYATDPETLIEAREGDLAFRTFMPLDVIRDPNAVKNDWFITRSKVNKWDLAAKYPEIKEDIIRTKMEKRQERSFDISYTTPDDDLIYQYTFVHKRSPSLPDGRQVEFVENIILTDTALPYRNVNLYRMTSDHIYNSPFSYTSTFDLVPLQEEYDLLSSVVLTNQAAFGVQSIVAPIGSNLSSTDLSGGLNIIYYSPQANGGPPESLNLTNTPPEIFNQIQAVQKEMETISGINSTARGNPPGNDLSGAAMALLQSQAISFNSPLQQSYIKLLEDIGTAMITQLRDYASVPRVAQIVGKTNQPWMAEFSGKDLSNVNRVQVDIGSAMSRTTSGKLQIAQMMLETKAISTADELLQVINTGSLEPLTEGKTHELLSIRAENEAITAGEPVIALLTDEHLLHINEHKCVTSNPVARTNPELIERALAHIQEHLNILTDPANTQMLLALGQQPMPGAPGEAPGEAPPGPGGPPGPPGPQPPGKLEAPKSTPENLQGMTREMMPNQPNNPMTGQEWNPTDGGLGQK